MKFPVDSAVAKLWTSARCEPHMQCRETQRPQDIVAAGRDCEPVHRVVPPYYRPLACQTLMSGNRFEAVMVDNWTSVGELAKRLVEKSGRGK